MENKEIVGKALGKVASGLYVVTSKHGDNYAAFTASFLVQVSFDPPLVAVAMKKGRESYDIISGSKKFAVNIIGKDSMKLVGLFANPKTSGKEGLDTVEYEEKSLGLPVLKESISYLECKVHSETDAGDHTVVFGEIVNGEVLNEGEPAIHIRKNGFGY
ncbi:MAG: flavin reductase family protein [Candidatus Sericytochromatia bacterium]